MSLTDQRCAEALERIAAALEHLAGIVTPTPDAGGWTAAPMAKSVARDVRPVFHAVKLRAGHLVTACAASGCGGPVERGAARQLADVPKYGRAATRCEASGCREVFERHPPSTQSS